MLDTTPDARPRDDTMRTPFLLLLMALAAAAGAYLAHGPALTPPLAVSLLAAIAATLILGKAALRPAHQPAKRQPAAPPIPAKAHATKRHEAPANGPHVVIDGSNVMHWTGDIPRLAPLKALIATLRDQGFQPGIIFDANAGYKLGDRYLDDRDFAKLLNLPADRVLVVGKGEPADPTILAAARELGAKVVTNDRFRDWVADFPEVASFGLLVKGGYRDGDLWLDEGALGEAA